MSSHPGRRQWHRHPGQHDRRRRLRADSDVTEEIYDWHMDNNLRAGFFLVQALYHRINDNGRVINISSAGARVTDPSIIVYTMAKAAVDAFTRVLAQDLGPAASP